METSKRISKLYLRFKVMMSKQGPAITTSMSKKKILSLKN